jgi:23S rRNA-/tRNA-specific pseudouridylate synthase/SAM-dependent methyltransferase
VHEDEHVLVVDKPAGMLSAAAPGGREAREPNVFAALRAHVRAAPGARRGGRGEGRELWIIHRLDRAASGLLVFAKSERAFGMLKEDLRARRLERSYLAVVEGEIGAGQGGPASGSVRSFVRETKSGRVVSILPERFRGTTPGPDTSRRRGGAEDEEEARLAVTHWKRVAAGRGRSLVEVRLDTGRKHQIRVHLASLGHPVVGDRMYGPRRKKVRAAGEERLLLHAMELAFPHPGSGATVRFRSDAPAELWRAVGAKPPEPAPETQERTRAPTPARVPLDRRALATALDTSWDRVADWYDELIDERESDHYRDVILPGALRLLEPQRGQRVLDLACGQGVLSRALVEHGVDVVAVDASPRLIELAKQRAKGTEIRFAVGDARALGTLDLGDFDAVACIMALANLDPLEPVLAGVAAALRPGGALVAVIPHPAFRAARQTSWGFEKSAAGDVQQYRRVDGYLSPAQARIVHNPGAVASGGRPVETWTFHRPLQSYVRACADAGLLVDRLEEWPSLRRSTGPRAREENRARREIPLFLALRARRA